MGRKDRGEGEPVSEDLIDDSAWHAVKHMSDAAWYLTRKGAREARYEDAIRCLRLAIVALEEKG